MANAQLLHQNLADPGSVTASSWIAAAPPSLLQNAHVSRRWKGRAGDSEWIDFDLGSEQLIDAVCVLGLQGIYPNEDQLNLNETAFSRVRLGTDTTTSGNAHNGSSAAGRIKEAYGNLIYLLSAPVTARHGRIEISQAGLSALLAGRLVVGRRQSFTVNFSYGWSSGDVDPSRKKKSAAGLTFIEPEDTYRILSAGFESLHSSDRYSFVQDADRLNGAKKDVLFVIDPDSADISRDTLWGLVTDLTPASQPNLAFYSKLYNIEERK